MRGSLSSMSISTSSLGVWGMVSVKERFVRLICFYFCLSFFLSNVSCCSHPSLPQVALRPGSQVGSGTPPESGWCIDPPLASCQTVGYQSLWSPMEACRVPPWAAAGDAKSKARQMTRSRSFVILIFCHLCNWIHYFWKPLQTDWHVE